MTALIRTSISILLLSVMAACTNYYEVPVETPLQPKLDISDFQRILVVGFVTGGSNEIDTNRETARLLSSQLRNNSRLQVIDADIIELTAVVEELGNFAPPPKQLIDTEQADSESEPEMLSEEDLEIYEQIFANVNYWRTARGRIPATSNHNWHGLLYTAPTVWNGYTRTGSLRSIRTKTGCPDQNL